MMRLKVQRVFDVTQTLAKIINDRRPLPTKGVYRVTRMHAKLFPEFETINNQRTEKIASYDHLAWVTPQGAIISEAEAAMANATQQPAVPDDKMPEFAAWWREIADVDLEVNIDPIPVDQLCIDGAESGITFAEFAALGDLVRDD